MADDEEKLLQETAGEVLETMLEAAEANELCPHCVGVDLIYMIAKEISANIDSDQGDLFVALHQGVADGENERAAREQRPASDDTGWTVH
jgi:hypothetical protein